jgi:TPR repeat protein
MGDRIERAVRAIAFSAAMGLAAVCSAQSTPITSTKPPHEAAWATIVDHDVPLEQRRKALGALEDDAGDLGPADLYVLGSIYHSGRHSGGLLDQVDPIKASLYFGNAATRGSIPAMAKMAELKLASHDYREAMNWAEIYAHYVLAGSSPKDAARGYVAELVKRISAHFGNNVDEVMRDVDAYLAAHDAQIRMGSREDMMFRAGQVKLDNVYLATPGQTLPPLSCIADFLVVLRPDGTVDRALPIDIAPDQAMLESMGHALAKARAARTTDTSPRYAMMTMVLDNGHYRPR